MGWANSGTDSTGRPIGYAHEATCDEPGCDAKIDRGLSYACGGMHGEDPGCEKYFCEKHLHAPDVDEDHRDASLRFCRECCTEIEKDAREYPSPITPERIVAAIQQLGLNASFSRLCDWFHRSAAQFRDQDAAMRGLDRLLQTTRKAGLIRYNRARRIWESCS